MKIKINSRKPFKRCDRIADQIKKITSQILLKETFFENFVMISVSQVKVSDDLKNADIYLSFYSEKEDFNKEECFKRLYKYKNHIKYKLGNSLKLKYMPKMNFKLSDEYAYYDKINRILKNDE